MTTRQSTKETLAINLRYLLDRNKWSEAELGRRSGVSQKAINNSLNMRSNTQIETCEAMAKPFGLEGWHLILPNLIRDIEGGGTVTQLVRSYLSSSERGQKVILGIAEREAEFNAR